MPFTGPVFRADNSQNTFKLVIQKFNLTSKSDHLRLRLWESHLADNRLNPRLDTPLQLVQALPFTHDM